MACTLGDFCGTKALHFYSIRVCVIEQTTTTDQADRHQNSLKMTAEILTLFSAISSGLESFPRREIAFLAVEMASPWGNIMTTFAWELK